MTITDRNTKRLKLNHPRRRSPRLLEQEERDAVTMTGLMVLLQTDLLHWRDAMVLGTICRNTHETWVETRDVHMLPLLNVLEAMVGASRPEWEIVEDGLGLEQEYILRLVLLNKNFEYFSNFRKCVALVTCIQFIVTNMQNFSMICLEDPSNRVKNPMCDATRWTMELGEEDETVFLHRFHRRGTFALNIALFTLAISGMEAGGNFSFNGAFLGDDDIGGGYFYRFFARTMRHCIATMYPFRDQDLAKKMRSLYPTADELEILGSVLTKKVVLMEPFFRFLPPISTNEDDDEDDNSTSLFQNLPTPLETLTDDIIIDNGMGRWL